MGNKKINNRHAVLNKVDEIKDKITDQEYRDIVEELMKSPSSQKHYVDVKYIVFKTNQLGGISKTECRRILEVVNDEEDCACCLYGEKSIKITEKRLAKIKSTLAKGESCILTNEMFPDDDLEWYVYTEVEM